MDSGEELDFESLIDLSRFIEAKMSFQQGSFSMSRDNLRVTDGQMDYNNSSRIEPKRSHHQWFMECNGAELSKNKRQATQAINSRTVSGIPDITLSSWQNASNLPSVSGQFTDSLYGSEHMRTFDMGDGNVRSVDPGNMNSGRKVYDHQFDSGLSTGMSMSHTIEDFSPCLSSGKKVRVSQVGDSNSGMPASMGYSMGAAYNRSDNNISLGPSYGNENENTNSMGPLFSTGQALSKGDTTYLSMYLNNHKLDENFLSMSQHLNKGDSSFMSIGQSYEKGDSNLISSSPSYGKANDKFISMAPAYNKSDSAISVSPFYGKGDGNLISLGQSYNKPDFNFTTIGHAPDKGDSSILSMGQNYNKGECNTISFGCLHDGPEANLPGCITTSYDSLINNHIPVQAPHVPGQKVLVGAISNSNVKGAPKTNPKINNKPTTKTAKKASPNNFPSNVKSLLSTGILDGVHVKYVSWSREKSLKGYIKGTGYVCGCNECNFEKALNAYEFERHASCKTKHPNNHIYFENGKTIYAVVQELKNTPQEMLFDAIQNVAGPQINQKNFNAWKASYQAAARELQRIYGKDEIPLPS